VRRGLTRRDAAILIAIAAAGLIIALQGWQARGPDADVIAAMVRASALVERGHVPQRGSRTDLLSFRPPGTSWLAVPGVHVFDDPRLAELTGSIALYVATLPGVFMLTRIYFGTATAWLAVLLYAFAFDALSLAAQLQPKAHPFFVVWMFYAAAQWVERRNARWLGAALVLWAAGTYVHMEMVPMLLALPVLWWRARPPITLLPLFAASAVALIVWSPYLSFQRGRDFVDLRSQLLVRPLAARSVETVAMCGDPPMVAETFATGVDRPPVGSRIKAIAKQVPINLQTRVPGGAFVLVGLLIGGLVTLSGLGRGQPLAILLIVPWTILVLLSGETNRTIGLLPLQAAFIAAFLRACLERVSPPTIIRWPTLAAVVAIMALNALTLNRARDWRANGWHGAQPAEIHYRDFRRVRCEDDSRS
jgi:4-amino-4-deoxy-L-arabinose transferase-like glycosyltransferase